MGRPRRMAIPERWSDSLLNAPDGRTQVRLGLGVELDAAIWWRGCGSYAYLRWRGFLAFQAVHARTLADLLAGSTARGSGLPKANADRQTQPEVDTCPVWQFVLDLFFYVDFLLVLID